MRRYARVSLVSLILSAAPIASVVSVAHAERLTLKLYSTADGLPNNAVQRIVADSRGFLWFCTGDGLSRFDGYAFTNYSLDQGLPSAMVNDLLETHAGIYWIATEAGLVRFDPLGPRFMTYLPSTEGHAHHVTSLLEDHAGGLWVATMQGLYQAKPEADGRVNFTFIDVEGRGTPARAEPIARLLEDRRGALWMAGQSGLYRRTRDGHIAPVEPSVFAGVQSLLEARDGTIWIGTRGGLFEMMVDAASDRPTLVRSYTATEELRSHWVFEIVQARDGTLWAGSSAGLVHMLPTPDGGRWQMRKFSVPQGIESEVLSVAEDRAGDLWLGVNNTGAGILRHRRITRFDAADGLMWLHSPIETRQGEIVAIGGRDRSHVSLNRFDGKTFITLGWLRGAPGPGWPWHQGLLQDRSGDWWIATGKGVFRFSGRWRIEDLPHVTPSAIYTTRDGLAGNTILALFEDSRGDVWISSVGATHGLSRWRRSTGTLQHYASLLVVAPRKEFYVSSITEDGAGNVWLGYSGQGGIARLDRRALTEDALNPDAVRWFTTHDGVPAGRIMNLFLDDHGGLWAATDRAGLARINDPDRDRPTFVRYTTAQGLSSNVATAVAQDRAGLMYICTGRGIDRLDPATGRFTHYSVADGVPADGVSTLRDRDGTLWFGSPGGLIRLVPTVDPPALAPAILIIGVRLGTRSLPISAIGERTVPPLELGAGTQQLQVDFVGLGSTRGDGLRYQHKLEGAERQWSQPSSQRTINFASLAPGAYRLLVRAVNGNGDVSPAPATLAFTVLPPVWQRWWFLSLAALTLAAAVYALHRARVVRLLEVANMRTRIATDLHDDIGANLTRIAILSEVARQQASSGDGHGPIENRLAGIARIARESVAGMSDIVWAISPDRDSVADLVRKMREHVEEVFAARNLSVAFHPSDDGQMLKLGATLRRDLYLIFKEAVNNAARHAHCSTVTVDFHVDRTRVRLSVSDNGVGFDPDRETGDGLGLTSMRRRAERLGASLEMASRAGAGTTVTLTMTIQRGMIADATRQQPPVRERRPTSLDR
jgi:signal transduction histidine kinase/streptogramin lyase